MEYTRTIQRTFEVGATPLLRVSNMRGQTDIRGEDRDNIEFTAQLRVNADSERDAGELFDAADFPVHQSGDTVEIGPLTSGADGPDAARRSVRIFGLHIPVGSNTPKMDIRVSVPRRCEVVAASRTGTLRIEGVHANVRAEGRTGRTLIADIEGDLEVDTRTGRVEIRSVRGTVRAATRTGRLAVQDIDGDTSVEVRTGAVSIRRVHGRLQCTTRTGSVRASDCEGPFDISTTTGTVIYEGCITSDGSIEVRTGGIRLAVTPDAAFFVDAQSDRGSVRSEIDIDDRHEPGPDAPTVRLRTRTGSIRIVPA